MLDTEPTGADANVDASRTTATAKKTAKKAVKKATPTKTAKKAAAKKTAKKATAAAATPTADEPTGAPAKKATKKAAAKKATKKTAAKKTTTAEPSGPVADGGDEAAAPRKRASRKKAAVPAFTAAEKAEAAADAAAAAAIPDVLFKAPEVVAPRTRRRATKPADGAEPAEAAEGSTAADAPDAREAGDGDGEGTARRGRRRGGRGRRGRGSAGGDVAGDDSTTETSAEAGEESPESGDDDTAEEGTGTRRRRRRRRKGDGEDRGGDDQAPASKARAPRAEEPKGIKGSVRIEAKRQRRREGREAGRRRPPVLTEAEFLARREAVDRVMVVRQVAERTQIAVVEDGVLVEHHVSRETTGSMIGNVYLGRVQNVLPSMEAAFVDIGRGRNAVLYAGEVNWDAAGLEGQPKRIEVALKSGDAVLVQVTKDPVGHKGARLTSQISLPGRYLVYVPDGSMTGISRKLPDTERSRLKSILKRVLPENAGVIVRTAAEGASEDELSRDVARLSAQWDDIAGKRSTANAPALLYGEPDMTVRVVRDIFNEDFGKLVVSGADAWETINDYVGHVAPDLHDRVEKWTGSTDVWTEYRIDEQLAKALDRKVWLPSGGSLVIDRTEAMTVVDVNTGKFTGQGGNLEQTVTENNLEAAEEIVRQLRLRDIGGIIVIDFIDMVLESNRELVLRRLVECLGRDRTKHQVAEVTSLGLVQMTRKRVGQGLLEVFSTSCESCNGRGLHVHMEPVDDKRRSDSGRSGDTKGGKSEKSGKGDDSKGGKKGKGAKGGAESGDDRDPTADATGAKGGKRGSRRSGRTADEPMTADTAAVTDSTDGAEGSGSEGSDTAASPLAQETVSSPPTPASEPAVVEPAAKVAPVLAPRGIDLVPERVTTSAPKRRRRGASRPAGAPEEA